MRRAADIHTSHLLQYGFFAFLFAGTLLLAFLIFKPFLTPIFLAVILAVTFNPFYKQLARQLGGRESIASFLTVLVVLVLIVAPLGFFGRIIVSDAADLYGRIISGNAAEQVTGMLRSAEAFIQSVVPGAPVGAGEYPAVEQYAARVLEWFVSHIGPLFSGIIEGALFVILIFMALFYMLKDGPKVSKAIIALSPLENVHDEMILGKIGGAINAVVRGRLLMALIQGVFAGIGFTLFGVPGAVFLAFLTMIASLVPMVGTSLVVIPSVLYLFFTGETAMAVGLAAWGSVAVALIDDVVSPFILRRDMHIHPFLILISVLGGLKLFGPVGFIAGPIVLALAFVLVDIYAILTRAPQKA